jgi:phage terminase large subunit-like protein
MRKGSTVNLDASMDLARLIRARHAAGESQRTIADSVGTSQGQVSKIIRGLVWPDDQPVKKAARRQPNYTLAAFEKWCSKLVLEDGSKFKLEPFQRVMLADHFSGKRELVCIISKKNGKTTLLGALALFHLVEWPEAECVIGAASRDQARILFRQASGLVRRSGLQGVFDVKPGYGEVRLRGDGRDGARVRVLAADASTADGVIPTLALVDELHRHPSGDLYGVFMDGLGPRDGQMITISTAGAAVDSPLGLLRSKAHLLRGFVRDEAAKKTYSCSDDGTFVLHEWALAPDDDVDDIGLVKLANPASWHSVESLRRRHDSPSMTPWQWRRFACGVWTEGEEPWIRPEMWDVLADPGLEFVDGEALWVGVDVGVRHDSTAIVTVAARGDGAVAAKATILAPRPSGLPLEVVEAAVREACEGRNVQSVLFDPWTFRRSAELLQADGLPMVEFPQSPERMANASENLYRLIEGGLLAHDGDPVLRSHVVAGVTKETERGWRLVKAPRLSRPIDALIALAMAALPAAQDVRSDPGFAFA